MGKLKCGVLALLWPALSCLAQNAPPQITPLTIGDTVPDLVLTNVINYPASTIRLSDLKRKLVILDFWSSWCGNCISLFPHIDSLQEMFKNNLQIILVNGKSKLSKDDKPKIEKILRQTKQRTGSAIDIPVIFDYPILDSLFPYNYIPHEVWLQYGKVVAITSSLEVNSANISALISGRNVSMRTKMDMLNSDPSASLLLPAKKDSNTIWHYQSVITGYREGLHGMGDRRDTSNDSLITGMYIYNESLEGLLRIAYTHTSKLNFPKNRVIFAVKDPAPFQSHTDTSIYRYSYCYEISVPPTTYEHIRAYMQQDIAHTFNLEVKNEKRKVSCLVIYTTPALKKSFSKGGKPWIEWGAHSQKKYIRNHTIPKTIEFLNRMTNIPLIDETGLEAPVDIDLPTDFANTALLISILQKAGFRVSEQERFLEVAVITDR
jgi:thiol-disulfide isomerase/thioredoxin